MTDQVNEAVTNLYHAVNAMLLVVGRDGEIDSRHESTAAVMQALRAIDGGQYTPELQIQAHPSRGVVDEAMVTRYLDAVHEYLGGLTKKQWQAERQDNAAALRRAARIGLTAALDGQAAALPAVPDGYVLVRRDSIERAAQMAEVFDDGSDGADAETAARVAHDLRGWLIAATPAHDQPEGEG